MDQIKNYVQDPKAPLILAEVNHMLGRLTGHEYSEIVKKE